MTSANIYANNRELKPDLLRGGSMAIIGTSAISNFLLAYSSGLGIGNIRLIGEDDVSNVNRNEILIKSSRGLKAKVLEERLNEMNDTIHLFSFAGRINPIYVGYPDVLIDTTNDLETKKTSYNIFLASQNKVKPIRKYISLSSDKNYGSIAVKEIHKDHQVSKKSIFSHIAKPVKEDDIELSDYNGKEQGGITSAIIAALALDEARKTISPLKFDSSIAQRLNYSIFHSPIFWAGKKPAKKGLLKRIATSSEESFSLKGKRALIVGAGGIGTYVGIGLALTDISSVDIYDGDIIENKNRNRMILYHNYVGDKKAIVSASELSLINPNVTFHGYPYFLYSHEQKEKKNPSFNIEDLSGDYDIVFSCVDNPQAKAILNDYALSKMIPFLDGGVSVTNGNIKVLIPGATVCVKCRDSLSIEGIYHPENSCETAVSNIVMPNAIIGFLMTDLAKVLLSGKEKHPLWAKDVGLNLNSHNEDKIYSLKIRNKDFIENNSCKCVEVLKNEKEYLN